MDDTRHTGGDAPARSTHDGDGAPPAVPAPVATSTSTRREGAAAAHAAESNRLLASLPVDEYEWLLPQLVPVRLRLKEVLIEAHQPIGHVHFVREGVCSMIATEQEGGDVEVGTIGCEGLVGLPLLFDAESSPYGTIVQVQGDAWRLGAGAFRRALQERPILHRRCLRFAQYFADQMAQSVACNRLHTLEERCARWLLMTHDRVHGDVFELTHEFLAVMLGVRRAGVTVAMGTLQSAGLVTYSRGRVSILDRAGLEASACGCYAITRASYDRLLG
jgi:CRP-like cAMP-binding protein